MSLFGCCHCFGFSLLFPAKTGGRLNIVLQELLWLFSYICPTPAQWDFNLLIALAKTFSLRTGFSSLLLMYLWQNLLLCFESLSCMSSNLWLISCVSEWDHVMLQYAVIASLIQFGLQLVQVLDFYYWQKPPTHYKRASFINSLLNIDPRIWPKDFDLEFISPKNFTPLLYCPAFVHCDPLDPFDIVLFPQQWFLDSNSTIKASF